MNQVIDEEPDVLGADIARVLANIAPRADDVRSETMIHPEPARFFEVPIQGPLPEGLKFIP